MEIIQRATAQERGQKSTAQFYRLCLGDYRESNVGVEHRLIRIGRDNSRVFTRQNLSNDDSGTLKEPLFAGPPKPWTILQPFNRLGIDPMPMNAATIDQRDMVLCSFFLRVEGSRFDVLTLVSLALVVWSDSETGCVKHGQ